MIGNRTTPEVWRPQEFGGRNARQIADPVIEPLWSGIRVLAHVERGFASLVDAEGQPVDRPTIAEALAAAISARAAVVDAYVTEDAARSGVGIYAGTAPLTPTPGEIARQLVVGGGRGRRAEVVEALEDEAPGSGTAGADAVLVVVDLLLLDGEPLTDVPLLERKRLLDSVVVESELIRVGIHVRAPIDPWLGTWRTLGFRQLAYKDANSRYRPGERNDGWATATIPRG